MRDNLTSISDQLVDELVPIPRDAPDVCPLCRSGRIRGSRLCRSCDKTSAQVDYPCDLVVPISYYTTPSPLRDRMHDYKEDDDPNVRKVQAKCVAAIVARYFFHHRDAFIGRFGEWDEVVAVPSTHHDGVPALQSAIETNYPEALGPFTKPLARGPGHMDFNQASSSGFVPVDGADVTDHRILLLDDTSTTGARLHSAHHALVEAGATVVAAVVVTRKINPDPKYGTDRLWKRQTRIPFQFAAAPWWAEPSPA